MERMCILLKGAITFYKSVARENLFDERTGR